MSKKPPRVRRPKPEAAKKTAFFTIRMTESERAEIDAAVSYDQSDWARQLLLAAARRAIKKTTGEKLGH